MRLRLERTRAVRQIISQDLAGSGSGTIRACFKQWSRRYRSFAQRRFDKYSKGGGDWPALALSTIRARRKGKGQKLSTKRSKKKVTVVRRASKSPRMDMARDTKRGGTLVPAGGAYTILRNTNTMFVALNPDFQGAPGALEESIPFGIRTGFGGPAKHPKSKRASIADLAAFHNAGNSRLPRRRIIVKPDQPTLTAMAADARRAMESLARSGMRSG